MKDRDSGEDYGKELVLDLHRCDVGKFRKASLRRYFKELCDVIDMQAAKLVFWEDDSLQEAHTKGISAVQFILTSNVTVHTLDILESVYVNIFSCKEFDSNKAMGFTRDFFKGEVVGMTEIVRK